MTPAVRASQVPSHAGFTSDLAAHFAHGLVIATPDYFIMARPVRRDAEPEALLDPWHSFTAPDAWMVWLAAGDLRKAMASLWPIHGGGKVWLAFQTDGPARFVKVTRLQQLYGQRISRISKQCQGSEASGAIHEGSASSGVPDGSADEGAG